MKISVLVPTLGKREKKIKRLLNSLKLQLFKEFEIIFVIQDNYENMEHIISGYPELDIKQIFIKKKGLSNARNVGLKIASGDIIVLSDDDCWYHEDSFRTISNAFEKDDKIKIVLSQIFDPIDNCMYKKYSMNCGYIRKRFQLLTKSSIEIAFKKNLISYKKFDERFGLGSEFVCGEEVDFLLNNFEKKSILYKPIVTVYHEKKKGTSSNNQIIAKGALYGKNYNIFVCILVLFRDLFLKKENNFKLFWEGYNEYYKRKD